MCFAMNNFIHLSYGESEAGDFQARHHCGICCFHLHHNQLERLWLGIYGNLDDTYSKMPLDSAVERALFV